MSSSQDLTSNVLLRSEEHHELTGSFMFSRRSSDKNLLCVPRAGGRNYGFGSSSSLPSLRSASVSFNRPRCSALVCSLYLHARLIFKCSPFALYLCSLGHGNLCTCSSHPLSLESLVPIRCLNDPWLSPDVLTVLHGRCWYLSRSGNDDLVTIAGEAELDCPSSYTYHNLFRNSCRFAGTLAKTMLPSCTKFWTTSTLPVCCTSHSSPACHGFSC